MATPDDILRHWQRLELPFAGPPRVIGPLPGGLTNRSFHVRAGAEDFVLRLNHPAPARLGIDRQRELRLLEHLSEAGCAPQVVACDAGLTFLVTRYVPGTPLAATGAIDAGMRLRAFAALREVHALPVPDGQVFDYVAHLERYWAALCRERPPAAEEVQRFDALRALAIRFQAGLRQARVCHHDPAPANAIHSGLRVVFVDWEYAGLGDPLFDYAAFCAQWRLPPARLGLAGDARFDQAQALYRYICDLWRMLQETTVGSPPPALKSES